MMSTQSVCSQKQENLVPIIEEKKERFSSAFLAFKDLLEKEMSSEEKLKMAIEFMRSSLSQQGVPRFKDFWDAKNICFPLFKEKFSQAIKEVCWTKYTELASEAKRLKEILEEQSSFAVEQIELALKVLEQEIQDHRSYIAKMASLSFSEEASIMKEKSCHYDLKQKEIQYYVTLTARLKGLREEVLQTEMRIRHKNRLLKEISFLGDQFIPKKKELIKEMSQEFTSDVESFEELYFDLENKKIKSKSTSLHQLREEIKGFQEVAKKLSLNAHSFSQTRLKLSGCWEIIKSADKEKKKEFLDRKVISSQQQELGLQMIEALIKSFEEKPAVNRSDVDKKREEGFLQIDGLSIDHEDKKALKWQFRQKLEDILKPFVEQENAQLEKQKQKEALRETMVQTFKEELVTLLNPVVEISLQTLQHAYETLEPKRKELKLSQIEENHIEELKKELYETLLLKKQDEMQEDVEVLKSLIHEWGAFKKQSRDRLELYKKEMSHSGFDFEKAMLVKELMDLEKARLDRAIRKIEELETL